MRFSSVALGAVLGAGLLLIAAHWLWPQSVRSRPSVGGVDRMLRLRLEQAGVPSLGPVGFVLLSLILGLASGAVVAAVSGVEVLAAAAGGAMVVAPWLLISARSRSRRASARAQWPDVVDHLMAAVRAGLGLPDAIAALSTVGPAQMRPAFERFAREYRASANFGLGIDNLKETFDDSVADRLFETLRMSREVGAGDIVDVLRNLAAYLRDDAVVRAQLRARQSWIVNAARLGCAAPWLVLALLLSRPEGAAAYRSPGGTVVVIAGLGVSVIAYRLMVRLGRLPEDKRWFR